MDSDCGHAPHCAARKEREIANLGRVKNHVRLIGQGVTVSEARRHGRTDRIWWPCLAAPPFGGLLLVEWTLLHWRDCITVGATQDARGLTAAARGGCFMTTVQQSLARTYLVFSASCAFFGCAGTAVTKAMCARCCRRSA